MSRQQKIKNNHKKQQSQHNYISTDSSSNTNKNFNQRSQIMTNDEFEFKYEGATKRLTTLPTFEDKSIQSEYINDQNESTYTDAEGKFVMVDQVRYKNLLNKLNELQQEFAELNKTTEDGRSQYTVNNHYRKMQSEKALKKIDELNE